MSTTEAGFYDAAMTGDDEPAMLPLADSPWLPVYEEAGGWIPVNHRVVDLGCGTGRFLEALELSGHYGDLVGVDFSPAALEHARVACERGSFRVVDLRDWRPDRLQPTNTTYACLEVLEHLEDDRELVRRIPPGHDLIFSVPNYESEAHLRVFASLGEVFRRYDAWLTLRRWSLIDLGDGKAIHLVHSTRRTDSW